MFKVSELIGATAARLVCGNPQTNCAGISIDTRTIKSKEAFVAIKGSNFDGHEFIKVAIKKGANCIIAESTSGIPRIKNINVLQVKNTQKALEDIARFQRKKFNIPVIAVSGSNGKTTTKEMLAWILSLKFKVLKNEGTKNNQIGVPLTLFKLDNSYDLAVLELGTNHFGEIKHLSGICSPNIGIVTNIGPAHLKYFKNLGGVFQEKYSLISNLSKPCIGILNSDDELLKREVFKTTIKPLILGFGIKRPADFAATGLRNKSGKWEFSINRKYKFTLTSLGYYNIYNVLAAVSVARLFGMEYKDIAAQIAKFRFPPGRLQAVRLNNMNFIDDTYNSNPLSLQCALEAFREYSSCGRKIFVMGDMLELGSARQEMFHRKAGKTIAGVCDILITVGGLAKIAAKRAAACGLNPKNIFTCKNSKQAHLVLFKKIFPKDQDIILVKGSRSMKMEEVLGRA